MRAPDRPFRLILWIVVSTLSLCTTLFIGHLLLRETGWLNDYSMRDKNEQTHHILADTHFVIPSHYLRHNGYFNERQNKAVRIGVMWPFFTPIGNKNYRLNDHGKDNRLYIMLSEGLLSEDSSERLSSVYKRLMQSEKLSAPKGLAARFLNKNAGYGNDILYYEESSAYPFVALCAPDKDFIKGSCLRDINLPTGVSIAYRFKPHLLNEWQALDDQILRFLTKLIRSEPLK